MAEITDFTLTVLGFGLDALVKTTALLALAGLLVLGMRRRSAAARHLVWSSALVGALAVPVACVLAPGWSLPVDLPLLRSSVPASVHGAPAVGSDAAPGEVLRAAPRADAAGATTAISNTGPPAAAAPAPSWPRPVPWAVGLLAAWGVGAAWMLGRLVLGHVRMAAIRRAASVADAAAAGLPAGVPLLCNRVVDVPVACGLLRPAIVVPPPFFEWTPARRRVVLEHELAHVERGDCLAQALAGLALAAWWFHPLTWMAWRRLRVEAERAADDRVLESGTRPSVYAGHLLAVVRSLRPTAMAHVSMAGSPIEDRLDAVLDPSRLRRAPRRGTRWALALALAVTAAGLGGMRTDAAPPSEPPAESSDDGWAPMILKRVRDAVADHHGQRGFSRAMDAHRAGRYDESAAGFAAIWEADPEEAVAAFNAGCAHARLGHVDEALRWLERALDAGFRRVDLLRTDADLRSLRGDPRFESLQAEAESRLTQAERAKRERELRALESKLAELEADGSDDGSAWYGLGMKLHGAGRHDLAIRCWERSAELGHRVSASAYNVACAQAREGRVEEALDQLERAVELGYSDRGNVERDADLDALREDPRFENVLSTLAALEVPGPINDLGSAREHRADWEASARRLGELVKERPRLGSAWFQYGLALLRTDRPREAAAAFARSEELGWKTGLSAYNTACAHARAGRTNEALAALEKAFAGDLHVSSLRKDPDLESLKGLPRFEALVDRVEERSKSRHWSESVTDWLEDRGVRAY